MSTRIDAIKSKQTAARDDLNQQLDRVADRWDTPVYSDGAQWTARQLLIHLMVSDKGQTNTVMAIARGENPVPADFDLEKYNRRSVEKRADTTPEQARAALAESLAERFAWLDSADESVLDQAGRHASGATLTVEQILLGMADHERGHADDIARIVT